jgi:hypothetical protein
MFSSINLSRDISISRALDYLKLFDVDAIRSTRR